MPSANSSIEDWMKKSKLPPIGSGEAKEKFEAKMKELELQAKEKETAKTGAALGVPYINLKGFPIVAEALSLIPQEEAARLKMIAFLQSGDEVRVASVNPADAQVKELAFQIGERTGGNVGLYIISENSFAHAFKLYDTLPKIRKIVKGVEISEA